MKIPFGKHKGKSLEHLLLVHPGYIIWILDRPNATDSMKEVQEEARKLITIFNKKRFVVKCNRAQCTRTATRCAMDRKTRKLYYWCAHCDPIQSKTRQEGLTLRYCLRICL
jgi:hypothetical protein